MSKPNTLRNAFERYYLRVHPLDARRSNEWFVRDDIWGKGGYGQPYVHFQWVAFKAGANWRKNNG